MTRKLIIEMLKLQTLIMESSNRTLRKVVEILDDALEDACDAAQSEISKRKQNAEDRKESE